MSRLIAITALCALPLLASDHIDGEVTKNHPLSDLSDLYAFPTPGHAGHLTVVLNTHPFATKKNHFSKKVTYRITLREATLDAKAKRIGTDARGERVLTFSFDEDSYPHTMTCTLGEVSRTVDFNKVDAEFQNGLRLFAGRRSDPFFFDAPWAAKTASKGELATKGGSNTMSGLDCLSLVVDLDVKRLFGDDVSLLALVAESLKADGGERFDRLGRPEVTNVTMVAHGDDADLRDGFNTAAPFNFAPATVEGWQARFVKNIDYYDALDGETQWTPEQAAAYARLVAEDVLVVDVTKPSEGEGYFAIERALLEGKPHTSAGGRLLNDDIMDTLFTRLINNGQGPRISDGVDTPAQATSETFPYLAAPKFRMFGWVKVLIARKLSGVPGDAYSKNRPGLLQRLLGGK